MRINVFYLAIILICLGCSLSTCQTNKFFQYATFYSSVSVSSSMIEDQDYIAVNKGYEETTQISPFDFSATFGVRKIARFDFEVKKQTWYIGNESTISDYTTISKFNGWEYLFNYSFIRNRGEDFTNFDFWIRYMGDKLITKAQIKNDDMRDLGFSSLDLRYRINSGGLDFSMGVVGRYHRPYSLNPIEDFWVNGENAFQELAEDFGYSTQFVQGQWHWFNDDELIATSNDEFFKHYFGSAIAEYNENYIDGIGNVGELSAVLGVSYYYYNNDYWLLTWANMLPLHYGLNQYSHEYTNSSIDVDLGLVAGWRVTKNLGFFVEGTFMRFWEKDIYECKFGFNYLIF